LLQTLKEYFLSLVEFSQTELEVLDDYFLPVHINKKEFLLKAGDRCNFIAFIYKGAIRHFHIKKGDELTCDISFGNTFITEFNSFNNGVASTLYFQALEATELLMISKENLDNLYQQNIKFENVGRKIAENVVMRTTEIAMSLASDKPVDRYKKLLADKPEIFLRVQQKYIANILGITPESLSRIRKRVYIDQKS